MLFVFYIDYMLFKVIVMFVDICMLCEEVCEYLFYVVCINLVFIFYVCVWFEGSDVKVVIVCGFFFGVISFEQKVLEVCLSVEMGVDEIDMVIYIGLVFVGDWDVVEVDVWVVCCVVFEQVFKVIIEICYLIDE